MHVKGALLMHILYFQPSVHYCQLLYLQVREARDLECQADTMMEEMIICGKEEYTNGSLPLLLHQV